MKKLSAFVVAVLFAAVCVSCASTESADGVTRVNSKTELDLSGYWNDTDVRIVAESLVEDFSASTAVSKFHQTYGRKPVVIVGSFKNDSDEHIDTSILSYKLETALLNNGEVDFVARSTERGELRDERDEQQTWASDETVKAFAEETGADLMLTGTVKTIVDSANGRMTRSYFVYAQLIDVQSNKKLWMGENSEIKKVIRRSAVRY